MDVGALQSYWGPIVAAGLAALVSVMVGVALYRRSAPGQLGQRARGLRQAEREHQRAAKRLSKATSRLQRLRQNAANVKPRLIDEASGELADAEALAKIANDRWLVAANHLRRVIVEEFPPHRHDALRRRYLPDEAPDGRPFSF